MQLICKAARDRSCCRWRNELLKQIARFKVSELIPQMTRSWHASPSTSLRTRTSCSLSQRNKYSIPLRLPTVWIHYQSYQPLDQKLSVLALLYRKCKITRSPKPCLHSFPPSIVHAGFLNHTPSYHHALTYALQELLASASQTTAISPQFSSNQAALSYKAPGLRGSRWSN